MMRWVGSVFVGGERGGGGEEGRVEERCVIGWYI